MIPASIITLVALGRISSGIAGYAARMGSEPDIDIERRHSLEQTVRTADAVVMATQAKEPLLFVYMIPTGFM